ncbi:PilZ domain-containing protein, partial [Bacillus cereus group sp. Bce007]|uniref:PilZ domain-containing protein n=1 Tax=Bacillus cereus group sp. Bce007 TaxID=3445254 RepID=UPI003F69BB35
AEIIKLGYDLKRKENRLSLNSQVLITLNNQTIHAVTLDLSPSGAKFKVPAAFNLIWTNV